MMRYIRLIQHLSNWWLYFAVKLGMTRLDPLIFRTRGRIIVEVPRRLLHEFKEIFMEASYTRGLALKVPNHPVIIDIGANAGFFTLFAAYRFPGATIFAYEPIACNYRQLKRNAGLNRKARILCFQKAVYGYSGDVTLSFDPGDSFTTSASVFSKLDAKLKTVQVLCESLTDIFDEHRIERCSLLKLDCEGAEFEILYNCPSTYLHRVDQMAIEVHRGKDVNQNITALADYLKSLDFNTRQYAEHMLWAWRQPR
jgi:FkbM family methyltransferase